MVGYWLVFADAGCNRAMQMYSLVLCFHAISCTCVLFSVAVATVSVG